jgi:zinc/manganese transport system substrate-binding protein
MKRLFICSAMLFALTTSAFAQQLNVVTTTEDLASMTREVGGDRVTVESPSPGAIRIRTSSSRSRASSCCCSKADLLEVVGRELEIGWLPPLLTRAATRRSSRARRAISTRRSGVEILEIRPARSRARWATSTRSAIRTTGSIRRTAVRIAIQIADKLSQLRPNDAAYFAQRLADFKKRMTTRRKRWLAMMAPYKGREGRHVSPLVAELRRALRPRTSSATSSRSRAFPPSPRTRSS